MSDDGLTAPGSASPSSLPEPGEDPNDLNSLTEEQKDQVLEDAMGQMGLQVYATLVWPIASKPPPKYDEY